MLDYQVWYDSGIGSALTEFASGITGTQYTATGLTPGVTYEFSVRARNSAGLSLDSTTVSVLAAQPPNVPSAPSTEVDVNNVKVKWTAPYNGGSAILSYTIEIQ